MTVFKHPKGKTWRYDFVYNDQRHTGTTGQLRREDAELVESQIKLRVRQEAYGIAPFDRTRTPTFSTWAGQHFTYVQKKGRLRRPDAFKDNLRLVLRFWGCRPKTLPNASAAPKQWRHQIEAARARAESAPYHDLRLADPIIDPSWIERFEDWMTSLGISGPRKNHYRSAMSGMYRTALLPPFRKQSNVTVNPFLNIERDYVPSRDATLTLEQLRALLAAAAPHLRVAIAIAAYAPELREGSILDLEWSVHLNPALTRIVVQQHKTVGRTHRPQIVPVSPELQAILQSVRKANPKSKHVISFKGHAIERIGTAFKSAVRRANTTLRGDQQMVFGIRNGGATFHTIRHSIATLLAEWGEAEAIRQLMMGHRSLATTQKYTHLAAKVKEDPIARLGERLQLGTVVQGPVQDRPAKSFKIRPKRRRTPEDTKGRRRA